MKILDAREVQVVGGSEARKSNGVAAIGLRVASCTRRRGVRWVH